MITASNLWKAFGAQDLFRGATLRILPGDRIAIVGPNGSGKTTLFEMIVGREHPDQGDIAKPSDLAIGYLRQETDSLRGNSVLEEVISGRPELALDARRMHALEAEMAAAPDEPAPSLLVEYGHLRERFEHRGGYEVEHEAKRILGGLGFRENDFARRTETYSGGWLMRIALAKLLVARPDLLLLDEPTNHLDLASVEWLEKFLASYGGTVVFTSHDREFINGFARKVIEVRDFRLFEFTGNYDDFVEQTELIERQTTQAAKQQARKIQSTTRFIERFRYKKTKARQVQSRIKMLARMDWIEVTRPSRRAMHLRFPSPPRAGRVTMELAELRFGYEEMPVFEALDLVIERDWKVALVGPNGAGKTTLLKLVAGVLSPQEGYRRPGHNVSVGYFAQHQIEALSPASTVLEEMEEALPPEAPSARNLLGRFLFSGDAVQKRVSMLSGGERTRLAMAKLLASPHNLLCLDEPTNHLDMQSRDVVGEALGEYGGAFVLITHDRNLIREVANRIVEVVAGKITIYDGNYDYYLDKKSRAASARVTDTVFAERTAPKAAKPRGSVRRPGEPHPRTLERRLRAALRQIEQELDRASQKARELESLLGDPRSYSNPGEVDFHELARRHRIQSEKIRELEAQWGETAENLEAL